MKKIKSLQVIGLLLLALICIIPFKANAATYPTYTYNNSVKSFSFVRKKNGEFWANRETGEYSPTEKSKKTYLKDSWKTVKTSNANAYCIQWRTSVKADKYGKKYKKYDEKYWEAGDNKRHAIIAGYIISMIKDQETGITGKEKYAFTVATIQHYLTEKGVKIKGSTGKTVQLGSSTLKFTKATQKMKGYISAATSKYSEISKYLKNIDKVPTASLSDKGVLKYKSTRDEKYYYSGSITFNNLVSSFDDNVTYVVTAENVPSGATATICNKVATASDATCSNSSTVTVSNGSAVVYLKVTGDPGANSTVGLKITGSNESTYRTSYAYYNEKSIMNSQHLMLAGKFNIARRVSKKVLLSFPSQETSLTVEKNDEYGNSVSGASFTLSIGGTSKSWTKVDEGRYAWAGTVSQSETTYRITETKAPSGFKKVSAIDGTFTNAYSTTCYNSGGTTVSADFCTHTYELKCLNTNTNEEGSTPVESNGQYSCTDEGYTLKCKKNLVDGSQPVYLDDTTSCTDYNNEDTYYQITNSGNNIVVTVNDSRIKVLISKKAITGDDEIPGAELKICTLNNYDSKGTKCDAIETVQSGSGDDTIGGDKVEWTSTDSPVTWEGIPAGQYVIVETTPPSGYQTTTATKFKLSDEGEISAVSTDKNLELNSETKTVVVRNQLTSITISKTDIATTKELPGATISICPSVENDADDSTSEDSEENTTVVESDDIAEETEEDTSPEEEDLYSNDKYLVDKDTGDCIPAKLADGTDATWVSGTSPKVITGLPAGSYYLVEVTAPNGYATAEEIQFTLKEDGTLTDKNGKSLANNKIVMKDAPLKDVKTGILTIIITSIICLATIGIGSYTYLKNLDKPKKTEENN